MTTPVPVPTHDYDNYPAEYDAINWMCCKCYIKSNVTAGIYTAIYTAVANTYIFAGNICLAVFPFAILVSYNSHNGNDNGNDNGMAISMAYFIIMLQYLGAFIMHEFFNKCNIYDYYTNYSPNSGFMLYYIYIKWIVLATLIASTLISIIAFANGNAFSPNNIIYWYSLALSTIYGLLKIGITCAVEYYNSLPQPTILPTTTAATTAATTTTTTTTYNDMHSVTTTNTPGVTTQQHLAPVPSAPPLPTTNHVWWCFCEINATIINDLTSLFNVAITLLIVTTIICAWLSMHMMPFAIYFMVFNKIRHSHGDGDKSDDITIGNESPHLFVCACSITVLFIQQCLGDYSHFYYHHYKLKKTEPAIHTTAYYILRILNGTLLIPLVLTWCMYIYRDEHSVVQPVAIILLACDMISVLFELYKESDTFAQ
jgi:hypothetical protein